MATLSYKCRVDDPGPEALERERFERRCLELAALFGCGANAYAELSPFYREFFEISGYARVCAMLVLKDLDSGHSQQRIAIKYGVSRDQVRFIQRNAHRNRARMLGKEYPGTM